MTPPASPTDLRWSARLWGTLVVLCTALFLDALDVSMVGVALPSLGEELDMNTSSLQWVVGGYVLGYGGFLLLGGRAADLLGRKNVFVTALGVFAVASVLGGIASDGNLLIATRFIKGIAAAFTAPAALSIITTTFPEGPARNKALGIFSATGASGFSLGLVLSGFLTEVGWRWTFMVPAIVALGVSIAAIIFIPRVAPGPRTGGFDIAGALTATGAMLLLVFGVVQAPEVGWGSAQTIGSLVGAAALLTAFILIERNVKSPLLRLSIFRSGPLVRANLGIVTLFGGYIGFQFVAMQYFQAAYDWSPIQTALVFLPAGLLVAVTSTRVTSLASRIGTPKLIMAGAASQLLGFAVLLRIDSTPNLAFVLIPGLLLLGGAFALSYPPYNIQATTGVPDHEQGMAGGLLNTSTQVGGAVVLAVVTAVVTAGGESATPSLSSLHAATVVTGIIAALGLVVAAYGWLVDRRVTEEVEELEAELADVSRPAYEQV